MPKQKKTKTVKGIKYGVMNGNDLQYCYCHSEKRPILILHKNRNNAEQEVIGRAKVIPITITYKI